MERIKDSQYKTVNHMDGYLIIMLTSMRFFLDVEKKDVQLLIECGLGTNNISIVSSMGKNGKLGASLRMWID